MKLAWSAAKTAAFWVFVFGFVWTALETMMLLHAASIDPRPVPTNDKYFWAALFGTVAVFEIGGLFAIAVIRLKEHIRGQQRSAQAN